jgi:hypothetical protein
VDRDRLIDTLGNLTLLTGRLNTKVSNAAWLGRGGKREGLEGHDVLLLNRELLRKAGDAWTDEAISERTDELANLIVEIWPVPKGHRSGFSHEKGTLGRKVDLAELINAGSLQPGMPLFSRDKKVVDPVATLLPDGRIDVGGRVFGAPSAAAGSIRGRPTNGWRFFLVDRASRRSLRDVWRDYVDTLSVDVEDAEAADEVGEDDA